MSKVKCPKCGHMNDANAEHCHNCGYRLKQSKTASATSFMQSIYKVAMSCPRAAGDVELNTKNRDKTIEKHNYGPLNLNDKGYWELVADKWNTSTSVAKKSLCGNCVAFDISPRMDDCMPGPVSDGDGRLGYCWMHHFKCHSARTCTTWAKGGPIKKDEVSEDWQSKAKGMEKEAANNFHMRRTDVFTTEDDSDSPQDYSVSYHPDKASIELTQYSRPGKTLKRSKYKHLEKQRVGKVKKTLEYDDYNKPMTGRSFHIPINVAMQDQDLRSRLPSAIEAYKYRKAPNMLSYDPDLHGSKDEFIKFERSFEHPSTLDLTANQIFNRLKNQSSSREYKKEAGIDTETPLKDRIGLRASYRPENELGQGGGIGIGAGIDVDKARRLSIGGTFSPFGDAGMLSTDYRLLPGKGISPTISLGTEGINFGLSNRSAVDGEEASTLENLRKYLQQISMEKEASLASNLAIGGGVLGAGTGALVDHDNRLRGALVGGSLGAGTGYAGGKYMEHLIDTDPSIVALKKRTAEINRESERATAAANKEIDAIKKRNQNLKKKNEAFSAKRDEVERRYKNGEFTTSEYINKLVGLLQGEKVASVREDILDAFKAEGGALGMKALKKHVKAPDLQSRLKDLIDEGRVYKHRHGDLVEKRASGEYDDSHMLSKILERMAAQSMHLKEKIDAGLIIPSWAEYKLYGAYDGLGKALGTAYPGEYEKEAAATATKTDPAKWEAAKREAKARMGGKHSARAMQLATQIYKKKGGGYSGAKPTSSTNSLKKWTKQDWGYSGKDKPGQGGSGVYLPKRRRDALKSTKEGRSMLASATRKKHKATAQGKQYSSHGLAAGTSLKKSASLLKRASSRVKSPDAFYQPTMTTPAPPIETMNTGNNEAVNMQAQQVAMANQQRTQGVMPPEAPLPSIQGSTPAATPPFRPRYTGM